MEIGPINQIIFRNIHIANAVAVQGGLILSPYTIQRYIEKDISQIILQKEGSRVNTFNIIYDGKGIIYTERIPKFDIMVSQISDNGKKPTFDVTISKWPRMPSLINQTWQA